MLAGLKERLSPKRVVKRQEKRQRRAMQFEVLERRILPSAGGIIASQMAKHTADAHAAPAHVQWASDASRHLQGPAGWGPGRSGESGAMAAASNYHLNIAQSQAVRAAKQSFADTQKSSPIQEIIFVDPSVTDYTQLIKDMFPTTQAGQTSDSNAAFHPSAFRTFSSDNGQQMEFDGNGRLVVVLNPYKDGVDQITQVLSKYQGASSVYVLSHGSEGLITLGTTVLDDPTLQSRLAQISKWQSSLAPGADILLYACDVAAGQSGAKFVNDLAAATGTVVAASTKDMGNGPDANWTLNYSTGAVTAAPLFSVTSVAGYKYFLTDHTAGTPNMNLTGGNGDDNYIFLNGWGNATVTDTGTSGTNVLNFSSVTSNLTFTFHANGTVSVTDANNDTLNNVANIQEVVGGSGTNRFVFDNGGTFAGTIVGGTGANTIDYSAYTTAVTVNLPAASGTGSATGTLGISNINNVVGSATANTTLAFSNGWGAVSVATTGTKTLDFSAVTSGLTFNINADGSVSVAGGSSTVADTPDSTGVAGVESIIGGHGTNNFIFAAGAALAGTINGGSGTSSLNYAAYTTDVTVDLQAGTATGTLGISNIRNVTGGSGNDTLTASATGSNRITAGSGNDTLIAGSGNDTLIGGIGNDTYKFSTGWWNSTVTDSGGTDALDFSAVSSSLTFTIGTGGTVSVSDGSGHTLSSISGTEQLIGGSGNNTFVFNNSATFAGTIKGSSGGLNTLDFSHYTTAVAVNFTTDTATVSSVQTTFSDISNVIGGSATNTFAFGSTSAQDDTWGNVTASGAGSNVLDFSQISSNTPLNFYIHAGTVSANDSGQLNTLGNVANVSQIIGGAGGNTFAFDDQGYFNGAINGGSGRATPSTIRLIPRA